jgi:hypothetical protein
VGLIVTTVAAASSAMIGVIARKVVLVLSISSTDSRS